MVFLFTSTLPCAFMSIALLEILKNRGMGGKTQFNGAVPVHLKMALTAKGRAEYSIIGINKIDSMLRTPNCRLRERHLSATIILQ